MFSLTYAELSRADAPRNALVLTMLYNQAINYHNKVLGIFGPPSPVTTSQVHWPHFEGQTSRGISNSLLRGVEKERSIDLELCYTFVSEP